MRLSIRQPVSTAAATLAGIGMGLACFGLALILGILFAQWSIADFVADLTPNMVWEFSVWVAFTVITLGVPVAAYLRFRLLSPVITLAAIATYWFGLGVAASVIDHMLGLAAYAIEFAPFYVVVYLVLGAVEWFLRR